MLHAGYDLGEMPLATQSKPLRVLNNGEYQPLGAARTLRLDGRILSSSNRELEPEVAAGRFRQDLDYRSNVMSIRVPPLGEAGIDRATLWRKMKKLSI